MSDNKNNRGAASGKGYYIALILCAIAIGITGYVYYRNTNQSQEASLLETASEELPAAEDGDHVAALATQPRDIPTVPTTQAPDNSTQPTEKRRLKTTSPVAGKEITGYSMEALSYNQTTRDWRVHNGVDLAAEPGTEVCAAADGKVYTVYEDDAMGHTVVIRHDDGYTTKYSSLSENVTVKAGDTVTMGQVIGYADDTAIVETTPSSCPAATRSWCRKAPPRARRVSCVRPTGSIWTFSILSRARRPWAGRPWRH